MTKLKRRCGNCKHFSYTCGDGDARDYPDGGDWGFCIAPVPMSHDTSGEAETMATAKAKHCPTYARSETSHA